MIFLVGPRQVGKTTLAKSFLTPPLPGITYFNWDNTDDRKRLSTQVIPGKLRLDAPNQAVIVFDEFHKYPHWKNALKGLFDLYEPHTHWIVTGSAALNVYRKGQDSLLGRSFTYHLAPFSVAELLNLTPPLSATPVEHLLEMTPSRAGKEADDAFTHLMQWSGFPEPLFKASPQFLIQWRRSRLDRLINQDLAAIENLRNLSLVETLMFLLPAKVGSPLSIASLREDLNVHFATVKHWLTLLEHVFYGFSLSPYTGNMARALKKERKWYLWDWTELDTPGLRFENLVAVHLWKYVNFVNDTGLGDLSLHYLRDKEKHEIDFIICNKQKPILAIECKNRDQTPSSALAYYGKRLTIPRLIQLVAEPIDPIKVSTNGVTIDLLSAADFLKELV